MRQWDGKSAVGGLSPVEIREICDRINRAVEPKSIILFGSRARGTQGCDSDIDILVLKDYDTPTGWLDIGARALCSLTELAQEWDIDFDVLATLPKQDGTPSTDRGPVYKEAATEGVVLYAA